MVQHDLSCAARPTSGCTSAKPIGGLSEGAIKEHAKDFKQVSTSSYWAKVSLQERVLSDAGNRQNWQTLSDDLDQTTREIGKMHDEITDHSAG